MPDHVGRLRGGAVDCLREFAPLTLQVALALHSLPPPHSLEPGDDVDDCRHRIPRAELRQGDANSQCSPVHDLPMRVPVRELRALAACPAGQVPPPFRASGTCLAAGRAGTIQARLRVGEVLCANAEDEGNRARNRFTRPGPALPRRFAPRGCVRTSVRDRRRKLGVGRGPGTRPGQLRERRGL